MPKRPQTRQEESINALTHLIGVIFCLVSMPGLLLRSPSEQVFWSVMAFAVGMLLVYTFSTIYHWEQRPERKAFLKKMDHISIYFLIAGTYTPFITSYLESSSARIFLIIIWSVVLLGIVYKLLFINRLKWVSVVLYLVMGWMALFVIRPLAANMPPAIMTLALSGGISYTIGVFFYVNSHKKYFHAIWHLFVLGGTVLHFLAIYKTVI